MMIETEHLILRNWQEADSTALYQMCRDETLRRSGVAFFDSIQGAEKAIRFWKKDNRFKAIIQRESGHLIGSISLGDMNRYKGYVELEYAIAADYRNRGYATEAVKWMVDYGFSELDLAVIAAWVRSHNAESVRVLEKCAFTLEGRLRKHARDQSDTLCYSILREEWRSMGSGTDVTCKEKRPTPKLVILRGNSGSGKTTVAKALQRRIGRNTLMIPQDSVRREMLWAHDGQGTTALPLLMELLRYGYEHSAVTILEGILDAECYRPLFELARTLYESEIFAYYYDLPFTETLRRHETKPNRADFGEADMRRWWKEKDTIGIIPETVITQESSLEETVERILSELKEEVIIC